LTFTMPAGIGHCCELHEMDFDMVREGISFLKNLGFDSGGKESAQEAVKPV